MPEGPGRNVPPARLQLGCSQRQRHLGAPGAGHLLALAACAAVCWAFGGVELPRASSAATAAAERPAAGLGAGEAQERLLGGSSAGAADNSTSTAAHGVHKSGAVNPAIFFLVTFVASALAQFITTFLPHGVRLPHSVLLYFIGTFMAYLAMSPLQGSEFADAIVAFANVDPHIIFWVFLPALLFEDAAAADWPVIQRVLPSALLLALPGVIVNTVLTGCFVRYCMHSWTWWMSLLLGSILSATDPVAVVGALAALAAPAKLSHLISGESLFNDGSAVALFQIFLSVAAGKSEFNLGNAIGTLCQLALGGPAFGFAVAIVACLWLKQTRKLNIQVLIILVCVYGSFFVGEHNLKVSGVLAVVVFGLYMSCAGHYYIHVGVEHSYHAIINFLALISHESIFTVGGVIGYKFMTDGDIIWRDVADLFLLYLAIHVTRTLVILALWPLLTRMGYGLTTKEAIICIYGGLRGAVGLAMASVAAGEWELGPENIYAKKIGFHTAGIVVLTLIINGTTITPLYKWLKVDPTKGNRHHRKLLKVGLEEAEAQVRKVLDEMKQDWFFHNCDFEIVEELVPKMSDLVDHEQLNFLGTVKLFSRTKEHVDKVVVSLAEKWAKKMADDPNVFRTHCSAKLERMSQVSEQKDDARISTVSNVTAATIRTERTFAGLANKKVRQDSSGSLGEGSEEMMCEVYQTVNNAIIAEYDEAYEDLRLPAAAHKVLSLSTLYQEDAIWGELDVPKYGVPSPDFLTGTHCDIKKLRDEERKVQMQNCFNVGWLFLEKSLDTPRRWFHRKIYSLFGDKTVALTWVLLTRNAYILLQYVATCERLLSDTSMFDEFTDILHGPLKSARDQAISTGMEKLMTLDRGMFFILEHILCARHVVIRMQHIIEQQHKEGTMSQEDSHRIKCEVLRPSEVVLEEFIPGSKHLLPLDSPGAIRSKPLLDRFLFDLVLEQAKAH